MSFPPVSAGSGTRQTVAELARQGDSKVESMVA